MRALVGIVLAWGLSPLALAQGSLSQALERYDRAVREKDVAAVHALLAEDVLLFEHSVRNDGIEDVFEHHLKPEIEEFENLKLTFSDVRVTATAGLALVTRGYRIQGRLGERRIDGRGNETQVWKKVEGRWRLAHIHYSHPCPRARK